MSNKTSIILSIALFLWIWNLINFDHHAFIKDLILETDYEVTVFISGSARGKQEPNTSLEMLIDCVFRLRNIFPAERFILSMDKCDPQIMTVEVCSKYEHRIQQIRKEIPDVEVYLPNQHLHQGNTLKEAILTLEPTTEILFLTEEDVLIGEGLSGGMIRGLKKILMNETNQVKSIRLLKRDSCTYFEWPCTLYSEEGIELMETYTFSQRPHFALRSHYENFILPKISKDWRKGLETWFTYQGWRRCANELKGKCGQFALPIAGLDTHHPKAISKAAYNFAYNL